MRPWPGLLLLLSAAGGCGGEPTVADAGPCNDITTDVPDEPGRHVTPPEVPAWGSNPPASGEHYGVWARWGVHGEVVDRGHWVHNLEHGGVAFLYNCPGGCPELVDDLVAFADTLAMDPSCSPDIGARWLITEDPLLPPGVTVAAAAWGWTYTATCFDETSLRRFYSVHHGHGPESTCAEGQIPVTTAADAGPEIPDGG